MNDEIRRLFENGEKLMKDFIYEVIFIPEGIELPDRLVIE